LPVAFAICWYGEKLTVGCWRCTPSRLPSPKQETYGLVSQMRRAAISIPANIAEGFRRRGKPDKARFLNIAEGSLEESRYYLILAQDLGYGDARELLAQPEEVSRMLSSYSAAIRTSGS
jgi:four helix bundle protein